MTIVIALAAEVLADGPCEESEACIQSPLQLKTDVRYGGNLLETLALTRACCLVPL